jgi:hypothetical protein
MRLCAAVVLCSQTLLVGVHRDVLSPQTRPLHHREPEAENRDPAGETPDLRVLHSDPGKWPSARSILLPSSPSSVLPLPSPPQKAAAAAAAKAKRSAPAPAPVAPPAPAAADPASDEEPQAAEDKKDK